MDHTALLDINAYYATACKTSQFPPINKDRIWLSARPRDEIALAKAEAKCGVIPPEDYPFLRAAGVAEIFGPGTNVLEAAFSVLNQIEGKLTNR